MHGVFYSCLFVVACFFFLCVLWVFVAMFSKLYSFDGFTVVSSDGFVSSPVVASLF